MTAQMTQDALMAKAERACASARALLDLGDAEGSVNRSYYAMYDAARAALLSTGCVGETHGGLIGEFGRRLVKDGPLTPEMGRALNRAHEMRQIADYREDSVELSDAIDLLNKAEAFIAVIKDEIVYRYAPKKERGPDL